MKTAGGGVSCIHLDKYTFIKKLYVNLQVYTLILFFKLQKHNYTKNINVKKIPTREGFEEK